MYGAAILQRELGAVARRWSSYVLRAVFVLCVALIVTIAWTTQAQHGAMSYSRMSVVGHDLFVTIFITELVLVSLAGPLVTGDLIAQERDRRTLDLLFVTPLRDLEIVLGKFLSRMAYVLALILLSLPVMLGCLVFGGVGADDILLAGLLVFLCGTWSGAVAMFFSALARKGYLAVLGAYFALFLQTMILPMLLLLVLARTGRPPIIIFLTSPQIYGIARIVGDPDMRPWGLDLWPVVAFGTLAGSLGLVALAIPFLRLTPGGPPPSSLETKVRRRAKPAVDWGAGCVSVLVAFVVGAVTCAMVLGLPWVADKAGVMTLIPLAGLALVWLRMGAARLRGERRHRSVWNNPVAWKEVAFHRSRAIERMVNLALLSIVGIMYLVFSIDRSVAERVETHGIFLGLELCACLVVAIVLASVSIAQEAEAGRFDLLLSTPMEPADILRGKFAGVAVTLAPLLGFVLFHALVAGLGTSDGEFFRAVGAVAVFVLLLYFHISVAMFLSLWTRRIGVAIGVCLGGSVCAYLFLPILAEVLLESHRSAANALLLYLNPVTAVAGVVGGRNGPFSNLDLPPWLGYPLSLGFYVAGSLVLQLWMRYGFDDLVRRNRERRWLGARPAESRKIA